MKMNELPSALLGLKVQTGSIACLGCGHEHNCGIHGCAVIREAVDKLTEMEWIRTENELPSDERMVLCIASGEVGNLTLKHAVEIGFYAKEDGWVLETWPEAEEITVEWWMELPQLPEGIWDGD